MTPHSIHCTLLVQFSLVQFSLVQISFQCMYVFALVQLSLGIGGICALRYILGFRLQALGVRLQGLGFRVYIHDTLLTNLLKRQCQFSLVQFQVQLAETSMPVPQHISYVRSAGKSSFSLVQFSLRYWGNVCVAHFICGIPGRVLWSVLVASSRCLFSLQLLVASRVRVCVRVRVRVRVRVCHHHRSSCVCVCVCVCVCNLNIF